VVRPSRSLLQHSPSFFSAFSTIFKYFAAAWPPLTGITQNRRIRSVEPIRDIGALHTRLVPGFVVDTKLEPGARIVTFGNGMIIRDKTRALQRIGTGVRGRGR